MTEHAWRERIPAFVLGALDPDAAAAFEKHVEGCSRCREEVEAYREIVASLASLAPAASAPSGLRARMPDQVAAEGEPGGGARPAPAARGRSSRASEPLARQGALRLPGPPRGHGGPRVPAAVAWLVAAGGVTVAVVAGAVYWEARGASEDLRLDYQQALARVVQLEAARADRDSMLAALRGEQLRTATLTAAERESRVRLFWNSDGGRLLITAFDLPPAPAGRTYQLWGLAPDRDPVALGTFQTGGDGLAVAVQELRRGERFERSSITEEPAGGSPRPTTTPLVAGPWEGGSE